MEEDNFIEELKLKYKVKKIQEGGYIVNTGSKSYIIYEQESASFQKPSPILKSEEEYFASKVSPGRKIGEDDIMPDFDNKIKKKHSIKGSIPTEEDIKSMIDNPLAKFDPMAPNNKNKKRGNDPDPDHEDFRRNDDYF